VLVRLDRHPAGPLPTGDGRVGPGAPDYERLFVVVRGGFAHRRKMLRRALLDLVDPEAFAAAGVEPTARARSWASTSGSAWPGAAGVAVAP